MRFLYKQTGKKYVEFLYTLYNIGANYIKYR